MEMKMQKFTRKLTIAGILLSMFAAWTAALRLLDVQPIGPEGTSVGFATVNGFVHHLTAVHWDLYVITDLLGLIPLAVCLGFGILGLYQWVTRKRLRMVDRSILILGGFYVVVMAAFAFFEMIVINYRPVLINGNLEASYPSSTTMLVLCVMPTLWMQIRNRTKIVTVKTVSAIIIFGFVAFMVIGRLLSGVHWFTDIVGGGLLSAGLVMMYDCFVDLN